MWRNLLRLYHRVQDPFIHLRPLAIHRQLQNTIESKLSYTPKLQRLPFSEELAKYLRYIDRKDKIKVEDMRSLVQAILTQYGVIHGLEQHPKFKDNVNYCITRKYQFKPNELSPYYGTVDYMVWLNQQHFVPILFFQKQLNPVAGIALAHATMGLKSIARNDLRNSGYSIITTGQQWQMFKVHNTLKAQKTVVYQGRNKFKNIVKDYEMIEVIMGLIDECLETEREQVNLLKLAYQVIDERKHMLEANSPQEAKISSPVSKLLLKYFQKKKDETSK